MPERIFASNTYRYGFNGKENNDEAKGITGSQQDYGFRVYDPRLGRFFSVDPLTKSYPELTPFQFASNSVISGIDLDGLEYLYAHEARIEVTGGVVRLKLKNFHNVTINAINKYSNDPKNWKGYIGVAPEKALQVVTGITREIPEPLPQDNPKDPSVDLPEKVVVESQNGKPRPYVVSINSKWVPVVNKGFAILDLVQKAADMLSTVMINDDSKKTTEHVAAFNMALENVNKAILLGWIDEKHQNAADISAITNVVLQGDNTSPDIYNYEMGMKIVKEIAKNLKGPSQETKTGNPAPPNSDAKTIN